MKENISFMTDATNLEDEHTRNRIRHHVLPYLEKEVNSESLLHIASAASELSYAQEYMEMQAVKWLKDKGFDVDSDACDVNDAKTLDLKEFRDQPYIIRKYIIMELLNYVTVRRKDITQVHIEAIDRLCMNKNGSEELHLPYGIRVLRAYDELKIMIISGLDNVGGADNDGNISAHITFDNKESEFILDLSGKEVHEESKEALYGDALKIKKECSFSFGGTDFRARLYEIQGGNSKDFITKVPRLPYTKWFDYDKILSCPIFRFRKLGDYIVVDRQGHKKSFKKFMTDVKIPEKSRNSVIIMADGDSIMWAIGHRSSCAYEISASTKHILEVDALSVNKKGMR